MLDTDMQLVLVFNGCEFESGVQADIFADLVRSGGTKGQWDIQVNEKTNTLLLMKDTLKLNILTIKSVKCTTLVLKTILCVDGMNFAKIIRQVIAIINANHTRLELRGMSIIMNNDRSKLQIAATDGFRFLYTTVAVNNMCSNDVELTELHLKWCMNDGNLNDRRESGNNDMHDTVKDTEGSDGDNINIIVSLKTLQSLLTLIDSSKLYISVINQKIVFFQDDWRLDSTLLNGVFPLYDMLFQMMNLPTVQCNAKNLKAMINQASLIVKDSQIVQLEFSVDKIIVSSSHVNVGQYNNMISIIGDYVGNVCFKPNMLLSVLDFDGDVKILIPVKGPVLFMYKDCSYAVLPLSIQSSVN